MAETLLQKAQRMGLKPAAAPTAPVVSKTAPAAATETLAQKAARLGIKPAGTPTVDLQKKAATEAAQGMMLKRDPAWDEVLPNIKKDLVARGEGLVQDLTHEADVARQSIEDRKAGKPSSPWTGIKALGRGALRTVGAVAGGVADIFSDALHPVVKQVAEPISNIPAVQRSATEGAGKDLLDNVEYGTQKYKEFADKHPEAAKDLEDAFNVATLIVGEGATKPKPKIGLASEVRTKPITEKFVPPEGTPPAKVTPEIPKTSTLKTKPAKPAVPFEVPETPKFNGLRTAISEKNVNPQVQTSFERLAGKGEDVAKKYEGFFDQEVEYARNAKADTAIAKVGENIGDAFEKVAKIRRDIGARMGNEIKRVGNEKIDISDSFQNFEQKLLDEANVVVEGKKIRSTTQQSALTRQDKGLLETYINDLNKLGTNPTAGNLDAFIRRVTNELELFKGKNNIMGTTNTERLIKSNLSELRDSFNPSKNPNFETYFNAKKTYSNLSDFLEEGQSFLGKKTQSGDYAKDASIAKSSVQSVLNNGKKDWLIRLEDLTGYPAIDDAAVALQAMKDAGNVQGRSLLELFSPEAKSAIPTSRGEVVKKIIDSAVSGGKRALVGSPKEQTLRVINSKTPKIDAFSKNKYKSLTEDLIKSGEESKTYIDSLADSAVSGDASVVKVPVKSLESILNKVRRDYNNYAAGIYNIKDVARNTIVAERTAQPGIVKKLTQDKSYIRHKIQDPLDNYGYRGNIVNFETPSGLHAEIQVTSPEMLVAKMPPEQAIEALGKERFDAIVKKSGQRPGLGHEYYDKIKEATEKGDEELVKSLIEQSENYYSHF